jgi:serine/threonine protein kinase
MDTNFGATRSGARPETQARIELEFKERIDGGRGGFGEVWRAIRRDTGEEVAVKVLRDAADGDARKRLEREVKILLQLDHPGIVKLIAHRLDVERPFYVMPLMKGGCLSPWAGKLQHGTVRGLLHKFADALHHIHARGGIHRDFKPDNVLIDSRGNAALADFGLGNDPRCTISMTAHAAGTPGYWAPELHEHLGRATSSSDIYSLGASIFQLLTGVHPAKASSLDPWTYNREIPEDLRNLVLLMVHQNPLRRPRAAEIIAYLGNPGQPVRVPVATSLDRFVEGALGIAAVAALALGFVVVAGAVVGAVGKAIARK